jgi:hypothetical protein
MRIGVPECFLKGLKDSGAPDIAEHFQDTLPVRSESIPPGFDN